MNNKNAFLIIGILLSQITLLSQDIILKPKYIRYEMSDETKQNINQATEGLYQQIVSGKLDDTYLRTEQKGLTLSTFETLQRYESKKDSTQKEMQDKQLMNIYPVGNNMYWLTIGYFRKKEEQIIPLFELTLLAEEKNGSVHFSIPLDYQTRYWKTQKVGNITYHFRNEIQWDRAKAFDQKNTEIAHKLGLKPEELDFYMCDNRQEIIKLQGFDYYINLNGKWQDGYGVDAGTIFAIQNNEDFSHDMFHYYSAKIHERKDRNWIAEEGVAYYWGNAYYTDANKNMIELDQLAQELQMYMKKNPDASLWELFNENTKIFDHISTMISVRSTISGIIVDQIETEYGVEGVLKLVSSGRKDRVNKYMNVTEELLGLNADNFDEKLTIWIQEYAKQ